MAINCRIVFDDILGTECNNIVTAYFEVPPKIFTDKLNLKKKVSESKFESLAFRIRHSKGSQYSAVHGNFVLLLCIVGLQFLSISSLTGSPKSTCYTNKLVYVVYFPTAWHTVLFIVPSPCGAKVVNYIKIICKKYVKCLYTYSYSAKMPYRTFSVSYIT